MKRIVFIILVIALFSVCFLFFQTKPRRFEGIVYDCKNNVAIPGVRVRIIVGNNVWNFFSDSGRSYEGETDSQGGFSIEYAGGSGMVTATKHDDYLPASGVFVGGKVKVGIMTKETGDVSGDFTTLCKKSSECLKTEISNGVINVKNTCPNVLPQL